MLAARPLGIFLRQRRDRRHPAVARFPAQPAQKRAHQRLGVEPVSLGPAMLARHRQARSVDHISLDAARPQPPRQPEAVAAGLERHRDAADRPAGFARLLAPATKQRQQPIRISGLLLERLALHAGHQTRHQPRVETQFDHRHNRAILIKGDEGSAQIVPFHGTLHHLLLPHRSDGATPSPPAP